MSEENQISHEVFNILIVDDVPANLKVLGDILKSAGYKVRPVPSGALALQAAEKDKPDLILLDIMMPDMDGYEVCRLLKENSKLNEIPIIFISALNDTNDIVKAFTAGGADYITKPFQAEEVKARVATHLKIWKQTQELRQLNSDKDRFIAILAHDLKNPVFALLGLSDLLLENIHIYDINTIEKYAILVNKSALNTYNFLDDLLLWIRANAGKLPFNPQQLNLNEICAEIVALLQPNADAKNIAIYSSTAENMYVCADANMLKTILRNIVTNAIKFTNSGGQIKISAFQIGANITIKISDNGIGIAPKILEKLFDVSQKVSTLGTAHESGSGLGLSLCKEFVVIHGGKISIESEENKGSVVSITIPAE